MPVRNRRTGPDVPHDGRKSRSGRREYPGCPVRVRLRRAPTPSASRRVCVSESSLSPATARYGGDHPVDQPGRQTTDLTGTESTAADPGSTGHNNADPDPAAERVGVGVVVAGTARVGGGGFGAGE